MNYNISALELRIIGLLDTPLSISERAARKNPCHQRLYFKNCSTALEYDQAYLDGENQPAPGGGLTDRRSMPCRKISQKERHAICGL